MLSILLFKCIDDKYLIFFHYLYKDDITLNNQQMIYFLKCLIHFKGCNSKKIIFCFLYYKVNTFS